jgi:hypothetical protein
MYSKTNWSDEELRRLHRLDMWRYLYDVSGRLLKLKPIAKVPFKAVSEMPTSFEKFKTERSLSIAKKKSFALFEYVEERPHMLSNFGMASILKKYYRGNISNDFPAYVGKLGTPV